jgi:hypothetical protein
MNNSNQYCYTWQNQPMVYISRQPAGGRSLIRQVSKLPWKRINRSFKIFQINKETCSGIDISFQPSFDPGIRGTFTMFYWKNNRLFLLELDYLSPITTCKGKHRYALGKMQILFVCLIYIKLESNCKKNLHKISKNLCIL